MHYRDTDPPMEIELYDHVEFWIGDLVYSGQITKLHPRKRQARVRYETRDLHRTTGNPIMGSTTLPVEQLALERRDG